MSESKAGELINIDNDSLNPGETINVFNFLNNDWFVISSHHSWKSFLHYFTVIAFICRKNAIVQEIDISEREILVNYEDDSQEWISVDTRKIRFPPSE